jgi:hypothetical protein
VRDISPPATALLLMVGIAAATVAFTGLPREVVTPVSRGSFTELISVGGMRGASGTVDCVDGVNVWPARDGVCYCADEPE